MESHPMPGRPAADRRVNVYIDGYNFYVPLAATRKESDYELAWCNFLKLSLHLVEALSRQSALFAGCRLGAVKYFTATIPGNMPSKPDGVKRKHNFLDALNRVSEGRVEVVHGTFRARKHRFYIENSQLEELVRAGIPIDWNSPDAKQETWQPKLEVHEEKQTDVMLATALLTDAAQGKYGVPPETSSNPRLSIVQTAAPPPPPATPPSSLAPTSTSSPPPKPPPKPSTDPWPSPSPTPTKATRSRIWPPAPQTSSQSPSPSPTSASPCSPR
jgi:hypothetical protein